MLLKLKNLRNRIDFALRSGIRLGRAVTQESSLPARDAIIQSEFRAFLKVFNWNKLLPPSKELTVLDVGARNFAFGPVLDELFQGLNKKARIHGIEIDAHRLLAGFYSRKSYGDFYSKRMSAGQYHPMDFFKWEKPADVIFLLNPFVSEEPTVSWGLPLTALRPYDLFEHVARLLTPTQGRLVLSCPSTEELEIARELAKKSGFIPIAHGHWTPKGKTVQQKPRYGIVYQLQVSS